MCTTCTTFSHFKASCGRSDSVFNGRAMQLVYAPAAVDRLRDGLPLVPATDEERRISRPTVSTMAKITTSSFSPSISQARSRWNLEINPFCKRHFILLVTSAARPTSAHAGPRGPAGPGLQAMRRRVGAFAHLQDVKSAWASR
jgi:hypothetical protein